MGLKKYSFIFFVITIFGLQIEAQQLIQPCNIEDLDCLRNSTQSYMNATQLGIPQYGIKAIDPMNLERLDLDTSIFNNGKTVLRNLTLLGYKNLDINQFRMNTETRSVLLETKARLTLESDIDVTPESKEKTFQGTMSGLGTALISTRYNYTFVSDEKDIEHFDVGVETITCTIDGQPEFSISKELEDQLKAHNISPVSDSQRQMVFCDIIKATYPTIMHNLRQAAVLLPKAAFFKNLW